MIGLHGVQDNAASFDELAPYLRVPSFLALDLPGHGRSSHFPLYATQQFLDYVLCMRHVSILRFSGKVDSEGSASIPQFRGRPLTPTSGESPCKNTSLPETWFRLVQST